MPPEYFKTNKEDRIDLDVQYRISFMYSEFACIVDHLIKEFGKEKFISYMKELTTISDHDKVFENIYGLEFDKCIYDFRESIIMHNRKK